MWGDSLLTLAKMCVGLTDLKLRQALFCVDREMYHIDKSISGESESCTDGEENNNINEDCCHLFPLLKFQKV